MIMNTLEFVCTNRLVASVYHDETAPDAHLTGYIVAADDSCCVIAHISSHGLYDGYILIPTEEIYRIDYNGSYEEKIRQLYTAKGQEHKWLEEIAQVAAPIRLHLLEMARKNHLVVSFVFAEDAVSGFVAEADEECAVLCVLDSDGNSTGRSTIQLDAVDAIAIDTDDEQDLLLLNSLSL